MRTECDWLVDAVVGRGEGGGDELLKVDLEEGVEVLGERLPSLLYHVFLRRQSVRRILLYHVTHQVLQIGCICIFLIQRYFFWKCCRWYLNYPSTRLHFKNRCHITNTLYLIVTVVFESVNMRLSKQLYFLLSRWKSPEYVHAYDLELDMLLALTYICIWPWPGTTMSMTYIA